MTRRIRLPWMSVVKVGDVLRSASQNDMDRDEARTVAGNSA